MRQIRDPNLRQPFQFLREQYLQEGESLCFNWYEASSLRLSLRFALRRKQYRTEHLIGF